MKGTVGVRRRITSGAIRDDEERAIRFENQRRASDLMFGGAIILGMTFLAVVVALIAWVAR